MDFENVGGGQFGFNGARVCDPQRVRQSGRMRNNLMRLEKFGRCCGSQSRAPTASQPFERVAANLLAG